MHDGKPSGAQRAVRSAVVGIVLGVLSLGVFNTVALPGCESCHARRAFRAATSEAPHATVDCRSCHVPAGWVSRVAFSLRQPLHMFIPLTGGADRDAAAVPDQRCLACHEDVRAARVSSRGIRISHESCTAEAACTDCHSATAHGRETPWVRVAEMDGCLACHIPEAKTGCDLCHERPDPVNRVGSRTFAVTHGPQWRSTHGMGDAATCMVCHQEDDCEGCHGPGLPHEPRFIQVHADSAAEPGAKCTECHSASFCDACHGTRMPHPAGFTRDHPRAAGDARETCRRCHAGSDCTACHEKHVHPGGVVGGAAATKGGAP